MTKSMLLAASAVALMALPAIGRAQDYNPPGAAPPVAAPAGPTPFGAGGDWTLKRREDWLSDRINKAHDEHDIDGHEADRVHHELDRIRDDENHMRGGHDGELTDNETSTLEARLDGLAAQVHWLHENAFQRPW